jgi:hypothetical protein
MRKIFALLIFLSIPNVAFAGPQKLNAMQIHELLSDRIIYSVPTVAPSEQLFQKAGATYFSENGNQTQGSWKIENDKYCSVWPPSENWVCYEMTREGNLINFISPSGNVSTYQLNK